MFSQGVFSQSYGQAAAGLGQEPLGFGAGNSLFPHDDGGGNAAAGLVQQLGGALEGDAGDLLDDAVGAIFAVSDWSAGR